MTTVAGEYKIAGCITSCLEVIIDRLTGLLGDLELDRPAGLPLAHCSSVDGKPVWCDILEFEAHYVTTPKLAIDLQIEVGQIPYPPSKLQPRPDCSNMPWL